MRRIIGIDVGGTNTNAAYIENGKLLATAKHPTNQQDILLGTKAVLEQIMQAIPDQSQKQLELHLSTTLITNTIVQGQGEPVAVVVMSGPGVNLDDWGFPFPIYAVPGAIDHRGRETAPLNLEKLRQTLESIRQQGITTVAIVGKFSVRNPQHELAIARLINAEFPEFTTVTLGHNLSGRLNFPRRIITALFNASIAKLQADFVEMVQQLSRNYGISEPVFLMKADGGTMLLKQSLLRPMETLLSGPAASIMGALALGSIDNAPTVTLDIGGTTTEIAVLVDGRAVEERDGAVIGGYSTLVAALFSRSMGLGGDSRVYWDGEKLQIGPERMGPPLALGGSEPTPTDAVIALGQLSYGDYHQACAGLEQFGKMQGLTTPEIAQRIIDLFCEKAVAGVQGVFEELRQMSMFTVSDVLNSEKLQPEKLLGMGGPAGIFIPKIAAKLDLPYQVLPYAEAANAVGAAASHPTVGINLRADTALGKLVIPELDEIVELKHPMLFELKSARQLACEKVAAYADQIGIGAQPAEVEIIDEEVFNVVRNFHTVGRIFSLKAQLRPGIDRIKL